LVEDVGWSAESSQCEGTCDARWYAEGGRSASVLEGLGASEFVLDPGVKMEVI